MSAITTVLGDLFTWIVSAMGDLITFISSNTLVLMFVVLGLVGIAVSMFRRIINVN